MMVSTESILAISKTAMFIFLPFQEIPKIAAQTALDVVAVSDPDLTCIQESANNHRPLHFNLHPLGEDEVLEDSESSFVGEM